MSSRIALVTGGAGFIGSNIVKSLLVLNYEKIIIFDNFSSGRKENIPLNNRIILHKIDLKENFVKWPQYNCSEIYHFAANADVRGGIINQQIDFNENVIVTKHVCDYAVKNNIKKVIFASSATVYGEPSEFPTSENSSLIQTSVYGASKLCGESYLQAYSEYGFFKSFIFRFVSWIGEGYSHGVIYDFVKKLKNNSNQLDILGDGNQVKSYLDVRDGVRGVLDLSNKPLEKSVVYNLGHEESMKVLKLADIICEEAGFKKVTYVLGNKKRGWIGDSPRVELDISKAKKEGWKPSISIENGIRNTVQYLLKDSSRLFR